MSDVKFVPDSAGIQAFLKSSEVSAMVSEYGARVASNAGDGFEYDTQAGKFRAICRIAPVTNKAKRDTYRNNALLKALHK